MSKMANEKRHDLIDRKTLAEELSSLRMMITGLRFGKGVLNEFMEEYRKGVLRIVDEQRTADAVPVEQYEALIDKYHELRENFVEYYCSGVQNVAPYCLNKCEECVDKWGYCKQYSDHCKGFNPAEIILDGDGNDI